MTLRLLYMTNVVALVCVVTLEQSSSELESTNVPDLIR